MKTVEVKNVDEKEIEKGEVITTAMIEAVADEEKPAVETFYKRYRARPRLVDAKQNTENQWVVKYDDGSKSHYTPEAFAANFEVFNDTSETGKLPELESGQRVTREDKILTCVEVIAGRGNYAYWAGSSPEGGGCNYRVVADLIKSSTMPHYAGSFVETFEGKPGSRAYINERVKIKK